MHLNHLDLAVDDVVTAASFLERHFDFTIQQVMPHDSRAILEGAEGVSLVLTRQEGAIEHAKNFHIGFLVDDVETVQAKHAELTSAGTPVGPIRTTRGTTQFYVTIPGGVLVEVGCRA